MKLALNLMHYCLAIGLLSAGILLLPQSSLAFDLPTNFSNQLVVANLDEPDSLQFSPDGRMFISERITGQLRVAKYDAGSDSWSLNAQPFYVFDIPKNSSGVPEAHRSAGLRDIAFDPNFTSNGYVYAFYMPDSTKHNRIVRLKASTGNPDVADSSFGEELLLEIPFNNQISTGSHNGGGLEFGNDGKLYISAGDGWEGDYPGDPVQSLTTFTGKIFRINPDGTIPTDNPFYNQTSEDYRAIYALGLRNPYSISKHPTTGTIYINEARGTNKADIYVLEAAANYGHEGTGIGNSRSPWANASDAGGQLITGGAWYPASGPFPALYHGVYFTPLWGGNDQSEGKISYVQSDTNTSVAIFEDNVGVNDSNGLDVKPVMTRIGPEGDLYYLLTTYQTSQGSVHRVSWTGQLTVQTPTINPTSGNYASAQTVTISTGTSGASIYYTLDGSEPTINSSLYSSSFSISTDTVVKAKAFKSGMNTSSTASESYTFGTVTNIPPSVDAGPDVTVNVGASVTLDGSGSTDPDGNDDLLSGEQWTQLSGPTATIIDGTEEIAFFTPSVVGTYVFRLEMSDGIDVGSDEVTITAINAPSSGDCNGNVLTNPGFENGQTDWNFSANNGGSWSTSSPGYSGNNAASLSIGGSGIIQFFQANISLQPNTLYRLSFAAYSSSGNDIQAHIIKHVPNYQYYGLDDPTPTLDLGTSWAEYSVDFTTNGFSSPVTDGRFRFWLSGLASAGDTYWIDDVCLTEVSNLTPPTPGVPTLVSPSGDIATTTPEYEWNAATDATSYELAIYNVTLGEIVHYGTYPAAVCSGIVCTVVPALTLSPDEYTWLVRASNNGVFGDWATNPSQ